MTDRNRRCISMVSLVWLCSVVLGGAAAQDVSRQTHAVGTGAGLSTTVWFQHIQTPLAISPKDALAACHAMRDALLGQTTRTFSFRKVPGADDPRAFFVSWSDGRSTAQTHFGIGETAEEAFAAARKEALEAGASSSTAQWVKLDIIQRGESVAGFVVRGSRLPLPSLFGLTFGPVAGFAFLPEEMISRHMVDSNQRLMIHNIGRRFLQKDDMTKAGRWLAITSFQGGQRICLFEPQSFFCDGEQSLILFRGHRLYDKPDIAFLKRAARDAGNRLVEYCTADGRFVCDLPEWEASKKRGRPAVDQALAVIALCRLYDATGDKHFKEAASRAAARLCGFIRPYGVAPRAGCIPELEKVQAPEGLVDPRQITSLDTNALAAAALCEVTDMLENKEFFPALGMLARHLVAQLQPGGDMISERDFPSLRLRPCVASEATGTAILAFVRLYDVTARSAYLTCAKKILARLRQTRLDHNAMEGLPRNPWLLEGLDNLFTFTRDPELATVVQRLSLAALLDQRREVDFPDMYGSVTMNPSATTAASRTHILAVAARLLRGMDKEMAGKDLLAEGRPYVLYQLQARMDPASSLYLEQPNRYLGLFRDHLRAVGFDLRGQALQVISLLTLAKELEKRGLTTMPEDLRVGKTLLATRRLLGTFPRYLSPRLASTAAGPAGMEPVQFRDGGRSVFTVVPDKGGKGKRGKPKLRTVPVRRIEK